MNPQPIALRALVAVVALVSLLPCVAQAATQNAAARVEACGKAGMAVFFATEASDEGGRPRVLHALTARHVVVSGEGERCTKVSLSLPEGMGAVQARVLATSEDLDVALLALADEAQAPDGVDTVALPTEHDVDAAVQRLNRVQVYAQLAAGKTYPTKKLGQVAGSEGDELRVVMDDKTVPGDSGAPVLDGDGFLLGLWRGGEHGAVRGDRVRDWVEDQGLTLLIPTPSGQQGIWVARVLGDADNKRYKGLTGPLHQELEKAGLKDVVEVRNLDVVLSGDTVDDVEREARWRGQSVNASLVVAIWQEVSEAGTLKERTILVSLARDPPIQGCGTVACTEEAAGRAESVNLPTASVAAMAFVAQATAAYAVAGEAWALQPTAPGYEDRLRKSLQILDGLLRDLDQRAEALGDDDAALGLEAVGGVALLWRQKGDVLYDLSRGVIAAQPLIHPVACPQPHPP